MDILNQLGSLVLGSVPTIIMFLLLVIAYNVLVAGPLEKTLAERRARTSGAVEQARGAIAAAEAETTAYEEKLRAARAELQREREQRMAEWQRQKDAALNDARSQAQERVRAARQEIEASAAVARAQMEQAASLLSEQILRAVLPAGAAAYTEAR